jgi:hypothetical protein
MDKQELTEVLRDLDGQLSSSCDVLLVGGAAMILHFGANRATRDIDVLLQKIRYFLLEQGWEID